MLARLLKGLWRDVAGDRGPSARQRDDDVHAQLRAALDAFLRQPPAHPKNIDYELVAHVMAAASSAEYLVSRMMNARNLVQRDALLDYALELCSIEGLVMEFGVYRGASLRAIARRCAADVHGFDSFEGLPDDWTYFQKVGRFSLGGQAPQFDEPNIRIHAGLFDSTLPRFLDAHGEAARFVHVDCDIYASTRTVLDLLAPRLVAGTVIVFDEYLNYPGWREHEFKAFQEFIAATGKGYRYIGFASSDCAVAVQLS